MNCMAGVAYVSIQKHFHTKNNILYEKTIICITNNSPLLYKYKT